MVLIQDSSGSRAAKLIKSFWAMTKGDQQIVNAHSAKLFLQACKAFSDKNTAVKCVEVLISNPSGVAALERAVRADLSPDFINSTTLPFILNLSNEGVIALNNGGFLRQILSAILEPCTFWTASMDAYTSGRLDNLGLEAFAWLCLQVASDQANFDTHKLAVEQMMEHQSLLKSQLPEVRKIAYRIDKVIKIFSQPGPATSGVTPGGRHDNDHVNFRHISIYPTRDEFTSTDPPYLQRLGEVFDAPMDTRSQNYRDWLFRLLREDMLSELREDLQVAMGQKKNNRRLVALGQMKLVGTNYEGEAARHMPPYTLFVACNQGVNFPHNISAQNKESFLKGSKNFMKHDSFGALCCDDAIIAFGSLVRDVDKLVKSPPVVGIKFMDDLGLKSALTAFESPFKHQLKFLTVDTATFAYEPILKRLKTIADLPLEAQLIDVGQPALDSPKSSQIDALLDQFRAAFDAGLKVKIPSSLKMKKDIYLQDAQLKSFIHGLSSDLALIQGPPGTGKSFLGALILLTILRLTKSRILVLSYTNHALDQFLEDLMDIGVSSDEIVRLGSKCTEATRSTLLREYDGQKRYWLTMEERNILNRLRSEETDLNTELQEYSKKLASRDVNPADILEYLEFSDLYTSAWSAFQVPDDDGFQTVNSEGKAIQPEAIYHFWLGDGNVQNMGSLGASLEENIPSVWNLSHQSRTQLHHQWSQRVREEQIVNFVDLNKRMSDIKIKVKSILDERGRRVLKDKRIIGCTTTAAAMYQSIIETASPDVILVEEAGEILEAHIITAMSASVKQLILIGDHKQLRPKVNNYALTKEKGEGYDLNVSLFERLVTQGHFFTALEEQHRSHSDISQYPRMLAYPELRDVPSTLERDPIRGLKNRVTFVHHEKPEDTMGNVNERRDPTTKASKRNRHEALMVLRMVRFLSQNGYKTENMVVLTPYLGQLSLLKDTLREEADPVLSDIDSHDLIRAGLVTSAAAKVNKKHLRLSTIDNYQGEECDIVIISLTRSNNSGDIGFMQARERLVVLLSRARNGMILFGNMETFMKSKKGGGMWTQYFDALKRNGSVFNGVPVHCERHPETSMLLKTPEDFDVMCPDGGCAEPCGVALRCGKHVCNRRCHRVQDHSNVECVEKVDRTCARGHKSKVLCGDKSKGCKACTKEDEDNRRRIRRNLELEKKRQEQQDKYRSELQEIEDEIQHHRRTMKHESETKEQADELRRKKEELESLRQAQTNKAKMESSQANQSPPKVSTPQFNVDSNASSEWQNMKDVEGARNIALDKLMGMIGLESVKDQMLSIKSVVDTKIRQGFSLGDERWSCSLLGNPGTGKTTVARIYAEFLTTVGAIPGTSFKEVSGATLANMGVSGCEKLLEEVKNNGGGCVFIDEAYQLSSGNSSGGKAVLDHLLTEVENSRGKIVFVLAGYRNEMESFFAHNPGIPSRFPIEMNFEDYTDDELLQILQLQIHLKFKGRMKVEQGVDGLFCRIVARRVGHGRGRNGFGNARAVENYLQLISKRQATRLRRTRKSRPKPDDLLLTQEDLIGPEPSEALSKSKAYRDLNCMIGLQEVKDSLKVFMDTLKTNYNRELEEKPLVEFSLNKVFLGSPGTGKTTIAKLYGLILKDLGLLSNGELVVKNPADFVGAHIGSSEAQTKGILASTQGKVLVIDEAYGLFSGRADGSGMNQFKTAVIDTIVGEVQSVPGEDRCVLLLGYKDKMEEMFQNVNPGLARRFPIASAFVFEDFDDAALAKILDMKLGKTGFKATDRGKSVALEVLSRARNRPNFGNAGEIDILLGRAQANHQQRVSSGQVKRHGTLEAIDFDQEYDRSKKGTDVEKLFEGDIGRETLVSTLQGYQNRVRQAKELEVEPEIPFNFLFRGPPGTGKTTAARKMGKVYYDMGFLASTEVIEVSATDLVAQYVGHTGPKVQKLLEKAMGRVLFIDEAYRLAPANHGSFAQEAIDELVDCITKPKFERKLIIILAGYVQDLNTLLNVNPGLSSRFPESIDFDPLSVASCIHLLTTQLQARKEKIKQKKFVDLSSVEVLEGTFLEELTRKFQTLSHQEGWANARDVKELAKKIYNKLDFTLADVIVTEDLVRNTIDEMIAERLGRMNNKKPKVTTKIPQAPVITPNLTPPTTSSTSASNSNSKDTNTSDEEKPTDESSDETDGIRDAGVSDEVWEQLQKDKKKEMQEKEELSRLKKAQRDASDADRERLVRQILAEEEKRKQIEARKTKLMQMGVCPMGYQWIKQNGGFRCAGGSHWMTDGDIDRM